ncbi:MAG: hypothetical protein WAL87_07295 [Chthoniobacterales bacterium]
MKGTAWKIQTDDLESEPMGIVFNLESRKTGRGFTRTLQWKHGGKSGAFTWILA